MKLLLTILMLALLIGCTSESDAQRALSAQGFSDVSYIGYDFFACSQDDFFHTGFSGKNAQGRIVTGTVCSGLIFKSATVRF